MDQFRSPVAAPVTRRELLNYAWLASLGILTVNIAGASIYFSLPRPREGEFGSVFKIGLVSNLPLANTEPLNYPEGKFWLVRTEKGLLALYKVCTHLDCLFNWNEQESKFICPCHGSQFDREGAHLSGPAPRPLDRFVIQLVAPTGEVLAETDPQTGGLLSLPRVAAAESMTGVELAGFAPSPGNSASNPEIGPDTIVQVDTGRKISGDRLPQPSLPGRA
jgi:cytochrome b6-f complex iron-sulfur subunit